MFTGIIEEIGTIKAIRTTAGSAQLTISARLILADIKVGETLALQENLI